MNIWYAFSVVSRRHDFALYIFLVHFSLVLFVDLLFMFDITEHALSLECHVLSVMIYNALLYLLSCFIYFFNDKSI